MTVRVVKLRLGTSLIWFEFKINFSRWGKYDFFKPSIDSMRDSAISIIWTEEGMLNCGR
jgi:hypothetical protein